MTLLATVMGNDLSGPVPPADYGDEDRLGQRCLQRMGSGDIAAMDTLYGLYGRSLFLLLQGLLGDRYEAEDVLQDVLVRSFEEARRYDPALGTPYGWLATMARRMALDALRRRKVRRAFVRKSQEQVVGESDQLQQDGGGEQWRWQERTELWQRLRALSAAQQRALQLAYWEGLTQEEIAQRLDVPLGTVKSDLRRGINRLRELFLASKDG